MKAAFVDSPGAGFSLRELPPPQPGPGQVLVKVGFSGLNPLDAKIRAGQADHARQPLPAVLGIDMAGTVAQIGQGVSNWGLGDEVFGMVGGVGGHMGTLSEYIAVDARLLARKPATLSMREAAVMPLITITAWEALVDRGAVGAEQHVLVHGGAGGVGHIAVQIAKARGTRVWATGKPDQLQRIAAYGATPIDVTAQSVEAYVQQATAGEGFDVVLDTLGGTALDASFNAVRRYTGRVVSILGWGSHSLAPLSLRGASYSGVFTLMPLLTGRGLARHGEILHEAARLAEAGHLRPSVDERAFRLEDATAAHQWMADGRARGKIAVQID